MMLQNLINLVHNLLIASSCLVPPDEISYSITDSKQIPLDHKIANRIGIRDGVFIEVGAHDGIIQSNTKLLEEFYGWTGVLVEPSSVLYKRLVNNRPHSHCFQCALSSPEENNTYLYGDFDGSLMASMRGDRRYRVTNERVLVRSLQSILDELNLTHIDFFSLDVEGYELNVLKGIDFNRTQFEYVLIEIYNHFFSDIVEFMQLKGYQLIDNFSNYNPQDNPSWDGTHNDFLFQVYRG